MTRYILLILLFFFAAIAFLIFIPWLRMVKARASVPILELLFMSLRKTAKPPVFEGIALCQKHQLNVHHTELETLLLAGGDPLVVVNKLIQYRNQPGVNFKALQRLHLNEENLDEAIKKASIPHSIQLFRIPVGAYYIDVTGELRTSQLRGITSTQASDIDSMITHKLRLAEHLLTGVSYQEAIELVEEKVLGDDFWAENGWVVTDKRIRVRTAN